MRPPSHRSKFNQPQYFDYLSEEKKWRCNACTSSSTPTRLNGMTMQAAILHERTPEHGKNVRAHEEWNPPQDADAWVNVADDRIDQVRDFIPFWRRTIEAAECGETLRFEDFLNSIKKDREEVGWNMSVPGWGWGSELSVSLAAKQSSHETGHPRDMDFEREREAFDFVEKIARMNSADPERKERLHSFYKMPTSEKVKRINELIEVLRKKQATTS